MKKSTVERLLASYFDPLADYLENRLIFDDSEELRSIYEILVGEKLDPDQPSKKAARTIVRRRIATALEKLKEPTSNDLKQLEELKRIAKAISRRNIWPIAKALVVALIPRRHGYGPLPIIAESDFPDVIAIVEKLASEHPELKRQIVYAEAGKKFRISWRAMQEAYLKAKKKESVKGTEIPDRDTVVKQDARDPRGE